MARIITTDQLDPDLSTNTVVATLIGEPTADIQVRKTVSNAQPPVGSAVTFTITVTNAGPTIATGVGVTEVLPAGLTLLGAVPSAGTYDPALGLWTIGDLALGASVHLALTATVTQAGPLTNVAIKTTQGEPDPVASNDASAVTLTALGTVPPPVGSKTVETTGLPELRWRVVWRNPANTAPLRFRALDPIPAATTYVDGSVTCVPRGLSTVARCDFDAATNQLVI